MYNDNQPKHNQSGHNQSKMHPTTIETAHPSHEVKPNTWIAGTGAQHSLL